MPRTVGEEDGGIIPKIHARTAGASPYTADD
jgi:hypothetical protein